MLYYIISFLDNALTIVKKYKSKKFFIKNIILTLKLKKISCIKSLIFIKFLVFHNFLVFLNLAKVFFSLLALIYY